jgi:hypothetical protein
MSTKENYLISMNINKFPKDPIKLRQSLMTLINRIIPYFQTYETKLIYRDGTIESSYNRTFCELLEALRDLHDLTFIDVRDMLYFND